MQLVLQWRRAALQLDNILFSPSANTASEAPRVYLNEIITVANALDAHDPRMASIARRDVARFEALLERWYNVWWSAKQG